MKKKYFFLIAVLFFFGNHAKAQLKLRAGVSMQYGVRFLDTSLFHLNFEEFKEELKLKLQKSGKSLSEFQYGPSFEVGIPLFNIYVKSSFLFSGESELKIPVELYYSHIIVPFSVIRGVGGVSFLSGMNMNLMLGKKNILDQIQQIKSFKPELKMGINVDISDHLQMEVSSRILTLPNFWHQLFSSARYPLTNFIEEIAILTYFF